MKPLRLKKPRPEIDGRFPGGGSFYCSMSGTRIAPGERGSERNQPASHDEEAEGYSKD